MTTTYTKLRDGSWGIRTTARVEVGASVTVTKKSGESKTETVSRVLWRGDGVALCSIAAGRGGDSYGHRIGNGASYRAGVTAPGGRTCPNCGSRECSRAWNGRDLCDED